MLDVVILLIVFCFLKHLGKKPAGPSFLLHPVSACVVRAKLTSANDCAGTTSGTKIPTFMVCRWDTHTCFDWKTQKHIYFEVDMCFLLLLLFSFFGWGPERGREQFQGSLRKNMSEKYKCLETWSWVEAEQNRHTVERGWSPTTLFMPRFSRFSWRTDPLELFFFFALQCGWDSLCSNLSG